MITPTAIKAAVLFVNFVYPKKMFKSMGECMKFKTTVEKQISSHYNPVDFFRRMPTLSCELKPSKPKPPKTKAKPTKTKK